MLTWQQVEIILAVTRAINGKGKKQISIASGHGIGKSATFALLLLWFLICYEDAKIPVTAPTQTQMYDVLWSEIQSWRMKMAQPWGDLIEHSSDYVRVKQKPETWFARARTARKEAPEALAGLHAAFMMLMVDEASGVDDVIFNAAASALTGKNVLFLMISNPTRIQGYFYDSHHKNAEDFQRLSFSSIDSPIVDLGFVEKVRREHGEDSDEFGFRVLGKFPDATQADDKGWLPLVQEHEIRTTPDVRFFGRRILGIDPAGEGKDTTEWVVRDGMQAKVVMSERISNEKTIAAKTLTVMDAYQILPGDIVLDDFGVGAKTGHELGLMGIRVRSVNVGDPANDPQCSNLRAELHWKMRDWLLKGGLVEDDPKLVKELTRLRFRRNLRSKVEIMSKAEMKKNGWMSPNKSDALMLTFMEDFEKQAINHHRNVPTMKVTGDPYD